MPVTKSITPLSEVILSAEKEHFSTFLSEEELTNVTFTLSDGKMKVEAPIPILKKIQEQ